jgi:hypothetical protein
MGGLWTAVVAVVGFVGSAVTLVGMIFPTHPVEVPPGRLLCCESRTRKGARRGMRRMRVVQGARGVVEIG